MICFSAIVIVTLFAILLVEVDMSVALDNLNANVAALKAAVESAPVPVVGTPDAPIQAAADAVAAVTTEFTAKFTPPAPTA